MSGRPRLEPVPSGCRRAKRRPPCGPGNAKSPATRLRCSAMIAAARCDDSAGGAGLGVGQGAAIRVLRLTRSKRRLAASLRRQPRYAQGSERGTRARTRARTFLLAGLKRPLLAQTASSLACLRFARVKHSVARLKRSAEGPVGRATSASLAERARSRAAGIEAYGTPKAGRNAGNFACRRRQCQRFWGLLGMFGGQSFRLLVALRHRYLLSR